MPAATAAASGGGPDEFRNRLRNGLVRHFHVKQDTADRINDRFGEFTLLAGSMWGTARHAPDRVGFRKTLVLAEIT